MDQTTQVNFPVVVKYDKRKIWRHNTSTDLYSTLPSLKNVSSNDSWSQLKPLSHRPKSLNVPSGLINETKIAYLESPTIQHNSLTDTSLGSIYRERTPPFSSNSSITSNGVPFGSIVSKSRPKVKIRDDESITSAPKSFCRCYDVDTTQNNEKLQLTNTTKGLSWRNLHMSRAKLKATATTSELLSGFAMIAMVELQINTPTNVPEWLFVLFAVCTTVLVAVHIFALMISTYILPNIEAIAKLEVCEMVSESPHERMKGFIEIAWAFSTILGLFLFLIEVAILCWVKFWDYSFTAAVAATVIVIPVLITFVLFAAHFYHSLVVYKCKSSNSDMEKLENIKKQLDEIKITI
ncbi:calcium release-activated calcium channel protein 1-like isoform X2 [Diorhabda sublineata]|nr:calcium release-activated calcium channel protein 1-like isoform X2 [Diorhabda sublineata]XP_056630272.1 calcium release-activated calcium channel protein 1-like isoform X2 [Diorhabda sublineata]XP_056630273.1 calcium release-activated calcium channel protein 1-like isoform X2 [Diorhabda sublineata]XP_056630274.1 calcium release-activated calcium channel protein 1-like isoform X2 [Diorhabda sublineata]XP_056630275.1 calcium release-activated calcium channel protein 1-like isoform X2 [Diorhab